MYVLCRSALLSALGGEMKIQYSARTGSPYSDRDAIRIGGFLEKKFPDGIFTAAQVLELARSRTSPIHRYFEWDDNKAAERHRLRQASSLVTCLIVEVSGEKVRKYCTPVVVVGQPKKHYYDIDRARKNPDIWDQVLTGALEQAQLWAKRYERLKELAPIRSSIKRVERKLKTKKRSAR